MNPAKQQDIIEHMKTSEKKKLITINLAVWAVAILTHPLAQMLPTGSGSPPKIFSLLIPIFFMALACVHVSAERGDRKTAGRMNTETPNNAPARPRR